MVEFPSKDNSVYLVQMDTLMCVYSSVHAKDITPAPHANWMYNLFGAENGE